MKSAGIFLIVAAASGFIDPIPAAIFGWFGFIQLLNRAFNARAIHWMHAMTFEPFALLGAALLRIVPLSKTIQGPGRPILLVHGYGNHGCVWFLQKKELEAKGLGPIYAINLGHPFKSIRYYAEKVKAKADLIAQETGRNDLILIGHSMGGLVSAWYATKLAEKNKVTDVITIASPLAGTPMARLALGINAREMEPNSSFVQELKLAMNENKTVRFHHIATRSDQLVIPGLSAALPDNNHYILDDLGHASLLYSKRVSNKLFEWLEGV